MSFAEHEWELLARLRERFLGGGPAGDYWESARLCELYDATFAQRIAWKWRAVLAELARKGRVPRAPTVLDWGCGTAIAAREYAAACRELDLPLPERVLLCERSPIALELAAQKLRELLPGASIERAPPDAGADLLLASHVLGELAEAERETLCSAAAKARAVVWVEPGERTVSRDLMALRDRLLPGRAVLGPCTHGETCGLNRPGRERDWCHSFAAPAPEAFTSADWREFSRRLRIDLRSAPYAYFALGEPAAALAPASEEAALAAGEVRILGRPRLEKGFARIDACDASGVRVLRVFERDSKELVKLLADPTALGRTFRLAIDKDRARAHDGA